MAWPTQFASLAGGNQPLSLLDTMFQQVAAMIPIPCTATGATAITLTPIGNAPSATNLGAYGSLNLFSFLAAGNAGGPVTAQFGALASLNVYLSDGATQATTNALISGRPYMLMYSAALDSGGGGFYLLQPAVTPSGGQSTTTVLTSGSGTYTTPANCLQLRIRMIGAGGGGAGTVTSGGTGGDTIFNSIHAAGGSGGGNTGAGGSNGSGAATLRIPGGSGSSGIAALASSFGGAGGIGSFGGQGFGNTATAPVGSGGFGNVGNGSAQFQGGGAGEYVELVITNPSATYTYTVGAAGTAGTSSGTTTAGGAGIIIIEERYQD